MRKERSPTNGVGVLFSYWVHASIKVTLVIPLESRIEQVLESQS